MWKPLHKQFLLMINNNNYVDNNTKASTLESFLLKKPKTDRIDSVNIITNDGLEIGHSSMQGYRKVMEDHYIISSMDSAPNHTLVAIMDGHSGDTSALFVSKNLLSLLQERQQWKEYITSNYTDIEKICVALLDSFCEIDAKLRENKDLSGCTCVCSVITPTHIICASVGDSRCVIGSKGKTISMTEDHKPNNREERQRIESNGGFVKYRRVNGQLAMSRALGDFQYKDKVDKPITEQLGALVLLYTFFLISFHLLICIPDLSTHCRSNDDEVMILACDGIWDVISNDLAVQYIVAGMSLDNIQNHLLPENKRVKLTKEFLEQPFSHKFPSYREEPTLENKNKEIKRFDKLSAMQLAEGLVDFALDSGSTDNLSVLIVKLNRIDKKNEDIEIK